jgi:transcriptional regulator with XRE-family HTH domain
MPSPHALELQEAVAANIRRWRARRDLSQEKLAHAAGIGAVHLRNIERGVENITLVTFVAIADALQVRPAQLFRPAKLPPLTLGRPKKRRPRSATPALK